MNSKILLTTSALCLAMLSGCLEDATEAATNEIQENLTSAVACTTEPLKDNSGVKIICGGDSVGVVLNGKDGKDGKDGENGKDGLSGKDGESCYVTKNTEKNGYDVFCGEEQLGFQIDLPVRDGDDIGRDIGGDIAA